MNYSTLQQMLKEAHALSFQARFIPVDATPEDEYFRVSPPTYAPEKQGDPPRYLITDHGEVRLDSPQSFANRLEACIRDKNLTPSFDVVARDGSPLVNSRELAHRCFDAYLRDSSLNSQPFFESSIGSSLRQARPRTATAVFCHSPESLLFGAWDSHTGGGALAAKWRRCISGRIYGTQATQRPGSAQKNDPLGLKHVTEVYLDTAGQLTLNSEKAPKTREKNKGSDRKKEDALSNLGYGSVPCSNAMDGMDVKAICLQGAIHLGELRKYSFPTATGEAEARDLAARTALAALALWSVQATATGSLALRSGCELSYTEMTWVARYGGSRTAAFDLDTATAFELLTEAIAALGQYGLAWNRTPISLQASDPLLELIRLSSGA
jgi:CRISPR-associated protein Csb1